MASALVTGATAFASPRQGVALRLVQGAPVRVAQAYAKDLHNYGGPTLKTVKQYNLYVNCPASCWGTPSTFQNNLNKSTMIHITDQYVGSTANGRYPYSGSVAIRYNTSGTLSDQDVYSIVHKAAAIYGTGYGKMYHVFFAKGVNQCSNAAGGCYSPNNPNNWTYCAYHGTVNFSDIGHTIYSVEPYQAVSGCEPDRMPNGAVVDSTASTLSHETIEAITDVDVMANNLAWYNTTYGEIGDECAPAAGVSSGTVSLNGHTYGIQKEYSNYSHACKYSK